VRGVNIYGDPTLYTGLGYPPVSLLPFLPFILLPYKLAQGIWVVGSFAALLGSIWVTIVLVEKRISLRRFAWVCMAAFLSFPTKFSLGMGTVNIVALFLLLFSLRLMGKNRDRKAGLFLACALVLKPHFALLLVPFLHHKQRAVGVAAVVLVLMGMIIGGLFGWNLWLEYAVKAAPPLLRFTGKEIYYNQGISAVFSRLLPVGQAGVAALAGSILVIAWAYQYMKTHSMTVFKSVAFFMPVLLLVEPLSWQHHYVFLLPTFLVVWRALRRKDHWKIALLLASYILISANIKQPDLLSPSFMSRIALSHVFWGNMLLLTLYAMVVPAQNRSARL